MNQNEVNLKRIRKLTDTLGLVLRKIGVVDDQKGSCDLLAEAEEFLLNQTPPDALELDEYRISKKNLRRILVRASGSNRRTWWG